MESYGKTTSLPVPADEAFAWHARPGAFERLVPPWQRLEVIERATALEDGSRLVFRLRRGPFAFRWVAEHRDVVAGRRFVDVQVEGPFAAWRHVHAFVPEDGGCRLEDEIDYELPLGPLGRLAGGSVRRDLGRVFAWRHRTTREDLEVHARTADRPRLTVAIAGASGLVGSALDAFLTTGGHRVVRLVRRPARNDDEASWDPKRGVLDAERLDGCDAVVYLAGESIAGGRWTARRKERLLASRVEAVERLVASLDGLERPPGCFVSASGVNVYGDRGDAEVDEGCARGEGFLAELAARWEEASAQASEIGARVVTLRLGAVLTPRGGALGKMLPAFKLGAGGPLGSGRQYMPWVSLDDAVGAVHHALVDDGLEGPINVVAPEAVRQRVFASTLGRVLGRPAFLPAPAPALRLALGEMADEMLLASVRAVPSKLLERGYRFRDGELGDALRHLLGVGLGAHDEA